MTKSTEHRDAQTGGGNTNSSSRCRRWCFTLNNYSEEEYKALEAQSTEFKIIGREVGESGTPHLQGYFEYKNPRTLNGLKKINSRIHWEIARGTREDNIKYCSKDNNYIEDEEVELDEQLRQEFLNEYNNTIWKDWQQEILDLIKTEPDRRTVNWYYEENGNVGKSYLANYLCAKYTTIICDGKKDNIFNQIKTMIKDEKKKPELIICDIPRSSRGFINYGVLEQIKNGVIYSGKYEGGQLFLPKLHLLVFSNDMPDIDEMSKDRWNVRGIDS